MAWTDLIYLPRNLHRLGEILQVLASNGLGHIVQNLNLQEHIPFAARLLGRRKGEEPAQDPETLARRLATALQQLGPTFVKMGQMLSSRPDLLPQSFIDEFRKLQDHVAPFSSQKAMDIIRRELGAQADDFQELDPEPFASGSIAQVHSARLRDGSKVVVKIRRPGIESTIAGDIAILSYLAERAQKHFPEFNPKAIVTEFDKCIRRELDLVTEASYTAKFQRAFENDPNLRCPNVYWDLTTSHVLTLELIEGISVSEAGALSESGIDQHRVAATLADAFMKQFFHMGLFHADPHPGNILVLPDGTIGLVDFGLVGHLTPELRSQLVTIVIALARQDINLAVEAYGEIGEFAADADPKQLKPDLLEMLDKYHGIPLKRIQTQEVFADMTRVARAHGVVLPRDLILLARAFVTVTSVTRQLDPDFDLVAMVEPHTRALLKDKFSPSRLAKTFGVNLWHLATLFARLPGNLRQIIRKIEHGSLQIVFKHEGLENFMSEVDRASNRISVSMILGSVIIGSSLIMHSKIGPKIFSDISAFGLLGYLVAGMMGLWLAWDILRSGRY